MALFKQLIKFEEVTEPITELVTKFGGQPVWQREPQWPLSRQTGKKMAFVGQIRLDEAVFESSLAGRMAYFFITSDEDGFIEGTYEADAGENLVLIQPGAVYELAVPDKTGPALVKMVQTTRRGNLQPQLCEYIAKLTLVPEVEKLNDNSRDILLSENKIGGIHCYLQGDHEHDREEWLPLFQLDSCSLPFYINFGDSGIGYGFAHRNGDRGKFIWQCM